jgi:hypothetical protein
MRNGAKTIGTQADAATARASLICQPTSLSYMDHSNLGMLSADSWTDHGASPIQVGVKRQACPVLTVVAFRIRAGTLCARSQLCLPGLNASDPVRAAS